MSTMMRRRSKTGTAWRTPRWMRRASSTPEMTSISTPPAPRAASRNSSALVASRVADVATARMVLLRSRRCDASGAAQRRRGSSPRADLLHLAPPRPSRTMSFSRVRTSNPPSPTRRATTMWKLSSRRRSPRGPRGTGRSRQPPMRALHSSMPPNTPRDRLDLLEAAADHVVGLAGVTDRECCLHRLVEVAGRDRAPCSRWIGDDVLRPGPGQAVVVERPEFPW